MQPEFAAGYKIMLVYFLVCAISAIILRQFIPVPKEVFRKTLHMIVLGSIFILIYGFKTWWISALAAVVFIAMVYPILALAEHIPGYSQLLTERKPGEVKTSLIAVFATFALLICVCWGLLGKKYLIIASVLAWGLGDAAAALVGKRFGRHFIEGKLVEGRKSLEGTLAMFGVSFAAVMVVLLVHGSVKWYAYVPIAVVTAAVCAVVELYTKAGMDTVTCPLAAAAVMIPLVGILGG
ncbi:MAG: phosphatidate cytidylyltransferase [Syntrophomonadaceae bacterium]|nr:phosphatidate cytidylyltransferase [Syntrophomonadaceae bacterium]